MILCGSIPVYFLLSYFCIGEHSLPHVCSHASFFVVAALWHCPKGSCISASDVFCSSAEEQTHICNGVNSDFAEWVILPEVLDADSQGVIPHWHNLKSGLPAKIPSAIGYFKGQHVSLRSEVGL